jgi:hypothetical protein
VDIKPRHELKAVRFHGLNTNIQKSRDLLGVFPFGNELEDLALARRELLDGTFLSSGTLKITLYHRA